jgi:Fe-S-cluster containining protein
MRMSPISAPEPCPHIVQNGSFVFCGIYNKRPDQCKTHDFPCHRTCPIGLDVLGIKTSEQYRVRSDAGFEIIQNRIFKEGSK